MPTAALLVALLAAGAVLVHVLVEHPDLRGGSPWEPSSTTPSTTTRDVAVILGASKGIGFEWARALAGRGIDVVMVARGQPELEKGRARLVKEFPNVRVDATAMDLGSGDADALRKQLRALVGEDGDQRREVSFVVYNAAALPMGSHLGHDLSVHLHTMSVNTLGPLLVIDTFLPAMRERRRGALVLMSSVSGLGGTSSGGLYSATKAWTTVLAESLYVQLKPFGVHVLACLPAVTATPTLDVILRQDKRNPLVEGDPAAVVHGALQALGRGPVVYPGFTPKLVALLQWLVPAPWRLEGSRLVEEGYQPESVLVAAARSDSHAHAGGR